MTISVVSICNRALDLLGADPLTSLEDGTKTANLCLRNFTAIRDIVLRSYPWNSAMRRAALPALAELPAWGYLFQYELPTGPLPERCLRVHRVARGENYRIEGRRILTDYPAPLQILYVAQIDDPADFDPLLAESIAARLGVYLAANLTESASRVDAMREYYLDTLALARSVDAQEGGAGELDADVWLASRN
jgi:hypothetical protein